MATSVSVDIDGNENDKVLGLPCKENQDSNKLNVNVNANANANASTKLTAAKGGGGRGENFALYDSNCDAAIRDLVIGTNARSMKSPARSVGNRSRSSLDKHLSQKDKEQTGGESQMQHQKDTHSIPSTAETTSSIFKRRQNNGSGNTSNSHTIATATTASATSEIGGITNLASSKTPQSGLTIQVGSAQQQVHQHRGRNNHLIKMNPRDAASPRRNRAVSEKSKAYKEYETSIAVMPIDSVSINSWKENATVGSNTSRSHASRSSVQSSVGGLAYVETPTGTTVTHASIASITSPQQASFDYKHSYTQHHHNPTTHTLYQYANAASNSVSSRSTTSKRSHRSKSSRAAISTISVKSSNQQQNTQSPGPVREEQLLFEQRLCDQGHGVAVRKIHSNGKSQLRFVKCVPIPKEKQKHPGSQKNNSRNHNMSYSLPLSPPTSMRESSSRSVSSLMGRISGAGRKNKQFYNSAVDDDSPKSTKTRKSINENEETENLKYTKALMWGNKKKVIIPLYKFVAVRKGKTNKRTRKNATDASKLLSIVTNDARQGSLDIEAPTKLDRDKFAIAFSVFLKVPLEEGLVGESFSVDKRSRNYPASVSSNYKGGGDTRADDVSSIPSMSSYNSIGTPLGPEYAFVDTDMLPNIAASPSSSKDDSNLLLQGRAEVVARSINQNINSQNENDDNIMKTIRAGEEEQMKQPAESKMFDFGEKQTPQRKKDYKERNKPDDDISDVSSLTQGFDQEIVEELHQALNELKAELEASRAEAARAVKVAEQAIQSAESCSSNDWNSTVTHKAAEAAAQAQRRSAEAIAKQRQAEDKLAAERKSASFWRKQAQIAEEDAGAYQTRLAVAEVERAATSDELGREKMKAASYIHAFKRDHSISEALQRESLSNAAEQNKLLEIELDGTRRDLIAKSEEVKSLQDSIAEMKNDMLYVSKDKSKKKLFGKARHTGRDGSFRGRLLLDSTSSSMANLVECADDASPTKSCDMTSMHSEQISKIHSEATAMKKQFELLRRSTIDELKQLPDQARQWASVASNALLASQTEVSVLKQKLAMEMSNRRKLLSEVQDLRGAVRVYCKARPVTMHKILDDGTFHQSPTSIISVPSHEIGLLHREAVVKGGQVNPMSFEFDRMFPSSATQKDVYGEMEELVLSSLDGYNSCLMAFGQNGCGKTRSLIGDFSIGYSDVDKNSADVDPTVEITECGAHLIALQQIFTISEQRRSRFQDSFTLTILEINDEKIIDLVAETDIAELKGQELGIGGKHDYVRKGSEIGSASNSQIDEKTASSKQSKRLEIRTNVDGETFVQGLVSVPISSYEDVLEIWKQSLSKRAKRVQNRGQKLRSYEASSHLIATLQVVSTNAVTGVGTVGKVQFVDLAASDVVPRRSSFSSKSKSTSMDAMLAPVGNTNEWRFANRSISQLVDVVNARYQFSRSVPYRNSTLTHLLLDSFEGDTKVLLLACVSSDAKDLQNTANTLRFATKMRKVIIGKATKHVVSFA